MAGPPRTPKDAQAETAAVAKKKAAARDAATFRIGVSATDDDGVEERLVWTPDETSSRTAMEFRRLTKMDVDEFLTDVIGDQAGRGAIQPYAMALIAWLALREAGLRADLDVQLGRFTFAANRAGLIDAFPATAADSPKA